MTGLVCLVAYSKALGKAREFAAKHGCDVFSEKAGLLSLVGDERLFSTVELAVRSAEAAFAAANSPSTMTGDCYDGV